EVATDIRKSMTQVCVDAKPLPWPLTGDDLDAYASEDIILRSFVSFLTNLMCGESE
ncbi:hypothetical protein DPMN_087604, partial [Dreissena polymorpha]